MADVLATIPASATTSTTLREAVAGRHLFASRGGRGGRVCVYAHEQITGYLLARRLAEQ